MILQFPTRKQRDPGEHWFCIDCKQGGEDVELIPFKRWGGGSPVYWCPECGRED